MSTLTGTHKDFDTAVIFGLPYRDKAWSANTFMALRGLQNDSWLNADGDRPFGKYQDIRQALEIGRKVVEVVQAINRVRSRKVVDAAGNCSPVDAFMLLGRTTRPATASWRASRPRCPASTSRPGTTPGSR
jgi:hypothetical protein